MRVGAALSSGRAWAQAPFSQLHCLVPLTLVLVWEVFGRGVGAYSGGTNTKNPLVGGVFGHPISLSLTAQPLDFTRDEVVTVVLSPWLTDVGVCVEVSNSGGMP